MNKYVSHRLFFLAAILREVCQQPQPLNTPQSGLRNCEVLNSLNRASDLSIRNPNASPILLIRKTENDF